MRETGKVRGIAVTAVTIALYVALVIVFQPLSFLLFQFRVADALVPLVALLGMPGVYGIALGVFFGNLTSPLGPIDLLNTIPSFVGAWVIFRMRGSWPRLVSGTLFYSVVVGLSVGYMLDVVFGVPWLFGLFTVSVGVEAALAVGLLVYRAAVSIPYLRDLSEE